MAGASIGRPGRERPRRYRLIGFPAVAVQHDTLAAGAAPGGPVHTNREANRVGSGSSWTVVRAIHLATIFNDPIWKIFKVQCRFA